jgi:hypothetical protein
MNRGGRSGSCYGSEGHRAARRGCRPGPAAYGLSPPLFQPLTAYAARGTIFPAPARGNPAPRVWAISGPLDPVHTGQPRTSRSNELPSSVDLTAQCNTPSKLVILVRLAAIVVVAPSRPGRVGGGATGRLVNHPLAVGSAQYGRSPQKPERTSPQQPHVRRAQRLLFRSREVRHLCCLSAP